MLSGTETNTIANAAKGVSRYMVGAPVPKVADREVGEKVRKESDDGGCRSWGCLDPSLGWGNESRSTARV